MLRVLGGSLGGGRSHVAYPAFRIITPLTPNKVELIPTLEALLPRGGPVQDPVLTHCGFGFRIRC